MKQYKSRYGILVASFAAIGIPVSASAQWTETVLHSGSTALGAGGSQQVGEVGFGRTSAALWNGTASSWVNLNPAGPHSSRANGTSGTMQVGEVDHQAALWSGTAASWVNLNPAGAGSSEAMAIFGNQEVGEAVVDGVTCAGLWNGTAASWVNLNPAGNPRSEARGTSGNQQVGVFDPYFGAQGAYAALWSGTASSFVDLNPANATTSQALATSGVHQVGEVDNGAALWSGTANSFVSLNPAGAGWSSATGIAGNVIVGTAYFNGGPISVPGFWTGTAASWVALPTISDNAYTTGVSIVGNTVYIVGQDDLSAVVWTNTDFAAPEPAPVLVFGLGTLCLLRRARHKY